MDISDKNYFTIELKFFIYINYILICSDYYLEFNCLMYFLLSIMGIRADKITTILNSFLKSIKNEHFTFYDFIEELKERSFGVLLLILAIPNACLLASIPGISVFLGIALIFVSMQMILRRKKAFFPKFVASQKLSTKHFESIFNIFNPYLVKIEKVLKPRFALLTSVLLERVLGVVCLIHGVLIALPIPLGNFFCGVAIVFFALGMIAKDGVFMAIGYVLSIGIFIFFATSFHLIFLLMQKFFS